MATLKAVRGTRDLLPPETALWNYVEATARAVFARYGFGEIRTPIFEDTALFARGVGEETDIVSKEMYTWEDRTRADSDSAQSLTLRPENTAGVVRAYIEHKLADTGMLQKLFYIGPQFRRERPQRGRYRQFWQIGAEVLGPAWSGADSALRDAEVLEMLSTFLNELGVKGWRLEVNSVGSSTDRPKYIAASSRGFGAGERSDERRQPAEGGDESSARARLEGCWRSGDHKLACRRSRTSWMTRVKEHFAQVLAALDACGVAYTVNPRLVRGLDYYTRTTFEFTVPDGSGLGTQNALLGGGRYDGLSEMLGGPKAPGIGFAIGEDRLILTLQAQEAAAAERKNSMRSSLRWESGRTLRRWLLAQDLRRSGLAIEVGDGSFRLKKSFEAADKLARRMVIVGEDEVSSGILTVKDFSAGEQTKVPRAELAGFLRA